MSDNPPHPGSTAGVQPRRWPAYVGLAAGPSVWAVAMQLGLVLPGVQCRLHLAVTAFVTLALVVAALTGSAVSWLRRGPTRPGAFMARVGAAVSLVFAFALLLQAAAGFMLTGCER
ncbi:MAG: hypothetical protein JSS43_30115 [Proteobacteria bacterium]|nr:hypothetical protein [Pseudomonadota bacterium]